MVKARKCIMSDLSRHGSAVLLPMMPFSATAARRTMSMTKNSPSPVSRKRLRLLAEKHKQCLYMFPDDRHPEPCQRLGSPSERLGSLGFRALQSNIGDHVCPVTRLCVSKWSSQHVSTVSILIRYVHAARDTNGLLPRRLLPKRQNQA